MVGRLLSFWNGPFLGDMLVFGGVTLILRVMLFVDMIFINPAVSGTYFSPPKLLKVLRHFFAGSHHTKTRFFSFGEVRFCLLVLSFCPYTPLKMNMLNLQITQLKRNIIWKATSVFRWRAHIGRFQEFQAGHDFFAWRGGSSYCSPGHLKMWFSRGTSPAKCPNHSRLRSLVILSRFNKWYSPENQHITGKNWWEWKTSLSFLNVPFSGDEFVHFRGCTVVQFGSTPHPVTVTNEGFFL